MVGEAFFHHPYNRPFSSCLLPLFQNESSCETFHMKTNLLCIKMNVLVKHIFIWNGFVRILVFDTEAKGNSEMVYCFAIYLNIMALSFPAFTPLSSG
jgi:hypothetical protein